ncbi:hypothetical protein E3N88_28609 [Mikania micrantha]|uniref:GHMP kinase N-terminal domain-containing protein n=1 Tax=Mikania micrantha TaxID=192012 RepID=A0A5N6N098_9ASTR|nr:hypothetical protein E3N88_28609 [Mikania micrantha]
MPLNSAPSSAPTFPVSTSYPSTSAPKSPSSTFHFTYSRQKIDQIQLPAHNAKPNGKIQQNYPSYVMEECKWGSYAKGALYALKSRGHHLKQGLDSSSLSSSAAVGIAYLLALESANGLTVSPTQNIEYDRLIENEYLGLKNGILDQSAILLSRYRCLTCMDCKTKIHKLIHPPKFEMEKIAKFKFPYKILLAFSGLKQVLTTNPGYNRRVTECREAAEILLKAAGKKAEPVLSNVEQEEFEAHKGMVDRLIMKLLDFGTYLVIGLEAWACGNFEEFGKLISASGGCCVAFVNSDYADEAASFVKTEYVKLQPELASHLNKDTSVVICDSGDCA